MQNNQLMPGTLIQSMPDPQLSLIAEAILKAASQIAEAIHANAEATVLLARATAGEFEPGDEPKGEQYLDGPAK